MTENESLRISVKGENEQPVSLADYKGKMLLIVNTATKCGFTPQYEGLQKLYENYQSAGLEILDFLCGQFAYQAPGANEEINQFCSLHYHTTFPRFAKIQQWRIFRAALHIEALLKQLIDG
jgi:glutathione peroxidase